MERKINWYRVLGCTMFSLLNRLEKLDGAFNVMFPKVTLELRVPLAAKKGMLKCEMLIGIAVDKGQIKSIDEKVLDYFPEVAVASYFKPTVFDRVDFIREYIEPFIIE